MEPIRSFPGLTKKDEAFFHERVKSSLDTLFPKIEEIKTMRIALEAFLQDSSSLPEEGALKGKLEAILSIREDLSLLLPKDRVQSVFSSILENHFKDKISDLKRLEQASQEEKKRYLEQETSFEEEIKRKRTRLEKKLQSGQESRSVIESHDVLEREIEIEDYQEIVEALKELGASQEDLKNLSPRTWELFISPIESQIALESLGNYLQEEIFSWEQLSSTELAKMAHVLLMYKPRIDKLLKEGMSKEDLFSFSEETIHAFFLENAKDDLGKRWKRFEDQRDQFFQLLPEAQLQALKTKALPEDIPRFLEDLGEKAQSKQYAYLLAALYYNYKTPLPPGALDFFDQAHCESMVSELFSEFFDEVESFDWSEADEAFFQIFWIQETLSDLFESIEFAQVKSLTANLDLAAHFVQQAEQLLKATKPPSPLSLQALLQVQDQKKRALFLTYPENMRKILDLGISFNDLENADFEKLQWIVSHLSSLSQLFEYIPLQALLFNNEIPLKIVASCGLAPKGVCDLMERGFEFSDFIKEQNDELIQNGEDLAWVMDALHLKWQEFDSHPLKEPFIKNASQIRLLPEEMVPKLATLFQRKVESAFYAFPYAGSIPILIENEPIFQSVDMDVQDILQHSSTLHKEILKNPKKAAKIFSSQLLTESYIKTLSEEKLRALFNAPSAVKELLFYLPKEVLFSENSLAELLLENAKNALSLLSHLVISQNDLLSFDEEKIFLLIQETPLLAKMAQKKPGNKTPLVTEETFDTVLQEALRLKEKMEVSRGKKLLLETLPLEESVLSEENSDYNAVIAPACKRAKDILSLLEHAPSLNIFKVFEELKKRPFEMMRLLSLSESVSCLLKEGATLQELYSLSDEELWQACQEVSLRLLSKSLLPAQKKSFI